MGYENCGRKPLGWYRDLNDLLDRSFEVVMMALNDETPSNCEKEKLTLKEKAELASRFLVKRVGEKIDLSIEHNLNPIQLEELKAQVLSLRKAESIEYKPIA